MRRGAGPLVCCGAAVLAGCSSLPGKPAPGPEVPRPESVLSAQVLYAENCAGCHGADGLHGAATPLGSPVYQAWVDDASLRRVIAQGEAGTMMPPFAKGAGGDLTDQQIDALVAGMRADWHHGDALAGATPPPYADDSRPPQGSAKAGEQVYAADCARCHGPAGGKVGSSGSVLDPSFLALMTAQMLRTAVVVGRPDLGMPDWRSDIPGKPLSNQNVSDVVTFLLAQQPTPPMPAQVSQAGPAAGEKTRGGVR